VTCRSCSEPAVEGKTQCEAHLKYYRDYQRKYRLNYKEYWSNRYHEKRENIAKVERSYRLSLRLDVIAAYGGKCACCGTEHIEFLCVDHINNNGAEHRRELFGTRIGAGTKFYRWLKANEYPNGFQLLCWNCNSAKHIYGVCPHQVVDTQLRSTASNG
jgi:hypothetical protein